MAATETEQLTLLRAEHQAAWDNYRHLFGMRFDLLKYLFGAVFAVAGVAPVVLTYIQARGIAVRSDYRILVLLVFVSAVLALLALLAYGLLVNWNQALRKHAQTVVNIRKYIYGTDSTKLDLVTIRLTEDPVEDRFLHRLHSSPPAMEFVAVRLLCRLCSPVSAPSLLGAAICSHEEVAIKTSAPESDQIRTKVSWVSGRNAGEQVHIGQPHPANTGLAPS